MKGDHVVMYTVPGMKPDSARTVTGLLQDRLTRSTTWRSP